MQIRTLSLIVLASFSLNFTLGEAAWAGPNRTTTLTGPNGKQSTYNRNLGCTNGQCNNNATFTGPNGNQSTYNRNLGCTNGQCTNNGTWTGPNGKQSTYHRTLSH
ncbi:MAG: hypothetical protein JO235_12135 [Chroococcidiopsidaceae cyanobacterium CP_BM_RX_35]|nr:hypothetical protein [Chroococcidiopsidaceae cyanobacterium CP_BM_RX_35]